MGLSLQKLVRAGGYETLYKNGGDKKGGFNKKSGNEYKTDIAML